jgi:hypothetical protein
MSRRWLPFPTSLSGWTARILLLLSLGVASLIITMSSGAEGSVKLDESKTKIFRAREPAEVQLAIESSLSQSSNIQIHLDIIDPVDQVLCQIDRDENISASRTISTPLPFYTSKLSAKQHRQLPWMRLRYRIVDKANSTLLAQGISSFSEIAPKLFVLRLAISPMAHEGSNYSVRVKFLPNLTSAYQGVNHV